MAPSPIPDATPARRPPPAKFDPRRDDVVNPDARSLRGLAHPLRLQLLGLLRMDGPATASQLAARTGQSSGSTSYHLRQLAAYGFVVEDEQRGSGRDRWWAAAHRSTYFDPLTDADEESRALGEEYLRLVADANGRRAQAAIAGLPTMDDDLGPGWSDAFSINDVVLRLTRDEATALGGELLALAARYRHDDPEQTEDSPDGSQRVVLQFNILPTVASPGHGSAGQA
jgi:DNA-binding transcriptional ArsR family regulator